MANKRLTQEEYIERLKLTNPNIEIASEYIRADYPIKLRCCIHTDNVWEIKKAGCALVGKRVCNICKQEELGNAFKQTLLKNRPELKLIGNYVDNNTDVEFLCTKCNTIFIEKPHKVSGGKKCPKCAENENMLNIKNQQNILEENANKHNYHIIDEFVNFHTKMKCICNNNHVFYSLPTNILHGYGCLKCFKQNKEKNAQSMPLKFTHPDLYKMLKNKSDGEFCSFGSSRKIWWICPNCGNEIYKSPNDVVWSGLACKICSDGYSYPNKIMMSILNQLNIKYIAEYKCEWTNNKIYDFYISINNHNYAIEMDGAFHYQNIYNSLEKQQEIDILKNNIMKKHNVDIIRINCNYKSIKDRFEYIKNSILNTDICRILNTDLIDWNKCKIFAEANNLRKVIDAWKQTHNIREIETKLNLSYCIIRRCLYIASENKLIKENENDLKEIIFSQGYEEAKRKQTNMIKSSSYPVYCIETEEYFSCIKEATKKYPDAKNISCCINQNHGSKHSGKLQDGTKLSWKKITIEEFKNKTA